MALFNSGSFATSTPIREQPDSGFYENSSQSRNLSQTSDLVESSYLPIRKNLFGKRNISENVPDCQSRKHKLLLSRKSIFSRRDPSLNKDTPRTSRSYAGSNKSVHFEEPKSPRQTPKLLKNSYTSPLKQLYDDDDSGFCGDTPEGLGRPTSDCFGVSLLPLIEKFQQGKESTKDESLAYFKRFLNVSEAKNCNLSTSEMIDLYFTYRYQKTGFKPSAADYAFCEKYLLMEEMDKESEMFLSSWKSELEVISSDLDKQPKIDFLSQLNKINAHLVVSNILSYLSGYDLQNVSCVGRLWRKLVFEDEDANRTRLAYLRGKKKIKKEIEKRKLPNPFQRPQNFRILGCIENGLKEELQLKRTIKEINFDAFIEVGKSDGKHKPMKCPSCAKLSLQNKKAITKYNCVFCGFEFCCNCLKPYANWHLCGSKYLPAQKPHSNGKKYLRRL